MIEHKQNFFCQFASKQGRGGKANTGNCKGIEKTKKWRLPAQLSEPPPLSQHPAMFSIPKSCKVWDINTENCHVRSLWSSDQRITWLL